MLEIDIWYDWVDGDKLIGHLAPYDPDELGGGSERKARRCTGRGASTELTQVADGRRTIIETHPCAPTCRRWAIRTPEAIMAGPPTSWRHSPSSVSAKHLPSCWAAT